MRLSPISLGPWLLAGRCAAFLRWGALSALVYLLLFQVSVVRGSSMRPGIEDGDRILVEPWSGAERGDVVVLRYPLDPSIDYIKRVIGLPGDLIAMAGGRVWVNGELLDEPYIAALDESSFVLERVLPEHCYVLGDNRPRSSDSREFGQVPLAYLRGRVDLRIWPPRRAGFLR